MRIIQSTCGVALALAAAGCGGGDSDNVMTSGANLLSPAQVDLALGPETAAASTNEPEPANAGDTVGAPDRDDTEPARQTPTRPETGVAEPSEEQPANTAAAADNNVEE